jgi:hypothetical protein
MSLLSLVFFLAFVGLYSLIAVALLVRFVRSLANDSHR